MAAKKVSRATTKKLKDKWRAKQWYTIHAPDMFENKEIPGTPADDPTKLNNRIVEVTMQELTGDFSKSYIKLKLRINRIAGFDAYTNFIGHEFTSDYIRRLTRRRRTKIDGIFDVTTKDGYRIRVKPMAIAEHRIQSSQKAAIRQQMSNVVHDIAGGQRMSEFVSSMIRGDVSRDIFRVCKPIYRLKRIDIRRSQVLGQLSSHRAVEGEPEDIDAIPVNVDENGEPIDIDALPLEPASEVPVDGETTEGEEDEVPADASGDVSEEVPAIGESAGEEPEMPPAPEEPAPVAEEIPVEEPAAEPEEVPEEPTSVEEPAAEPEEVPEEPTSVEEPSTEPEEVPEEPTSVEEPSTEPEEVPEEPAPFEEPAVEPEEVPEEPIPVEQPAAEPEDVPEEPAPVAEESPVEEPTEEPEDAPTELPEEPAPEDEGVQEAVTDIKPEEVEKEE